MPAKGSHRNQIRTGAHVERTRERREDDGLKTGHEKRGLSSWSQGAVVVEVVTQPSFARASHTSWAKVALMVPSDFSR